MSWPSPPSVRLEGERVVLEPLRAEHEAQLREAAENDLEIWRWMPPGGARVDLWLPTALAATETGEEVPFATRDRASGALVGSTRLLALAPEHRCVEIGWTWLAPPAWGTGINVEAKLLMLEHAFERLGCVRVELKTDARNARSRGAMERLGASYEGTFRKHRHLGGDRWRDSAWYSVLDDEWPAVRAGLEARLTEKRGAGS